VLHGRRYGARVVRQREEQHRNAANESVRLDEIPVFIVSLVFDVKTVR
jgi:hypothetical protein